MYYSNKKHTLLQLFVGLLITSTKLFIGPGDSSQVLEGLYVVDGAIVPVAIGVNPTLTISCLAERCMRLLAKREGWHIDYDTFKPLGKP